MESRKAMLSVTVCVFALTLSINLAQAGTARYAMLNTTDSAGADRVDFGLGETVYIRWTAETGKTVDIRVDDESGTTVGGPWPNQPSTGVITYVPSETGFYYVYCTGAKPLPIAYGTIFVVPEVPLGTIMTVVASLGALGAFGTVKLKQAKVKRI